MRVLPGDQQAFADNVRRPVGRLREDRAKFQHLVFNEERHDFAEADLFFLAVGEAGDLLALHRELAVRCLDVTQCPRGMTEDADWLAGGDKRRSLIHRYERHLPNVEWSGKRRADIIALTPLLVLPETR